jgi:hypothetical protein
VNSIAAQKNNAATAGAFGHREPSVALLSGSRTVPITTIIAMVRLLLRTVVLVVSPAIGTLVASVLARHVGVGIAAGRGRVGVAGGHQLAGSSQ